MKKLYFFLLLSAFCFSANAQSLKTVEHSWEIFGENMDSAIYLVEKGYYEAQKEGNLKAMGRALSYRAIYYDIEGKADSALFLFFKALPIQESIRDTAGLVTTYNNLGIFNFSQYQFPQAMYYYKKAYQSALMLNDYSSAAGSLVNMGVIESYNPEGGKALEYYSEAEKLYMKDGDTASLYPIWSNTAKIYLDRGEYTRAYEYNLKSVKLNDDLKSMADWLTERILMTNILAKMQKWNEAEKYGLEGLKMAEENHLPERRQYMYEALSNVYYGMGNYKKAYEFTSKYRDLRDSLINGERAQQVAEMQVKFETERKNNEINLLKLEAAERKNIKLENERLHIGFNILAVGGAIVLIVVIIIIVLLVLTIRLERKNTRLESEKKQQTQALLEQEKILMRESHHRIKNNLQFINGILYLQSKNVKDPSVEKALTESRMRIQSISFAHQQLYGNSSVEKLNLGDFLRELVASIKQSSLPPDSKIDIQMNIDEINVNTDVAIPIGLIINELVTNSLKYAFTGNDTGKVTISLKKINNELELIIADNGKGMININEGTGFGQQLVKSMTKQLKATHIVQTNQGVQHIFSIPAT